MDDEVFKSMTDLSERDMGGLLVPRFRPMVVEPSEWRSYDTVSSFLHFCGALARRRWNDDHKWWALALMLDLHRVVTVS